MHRCTAASLALPAALLISGCGTAHPVPDAGAAGSVAWVGAQHSAVHDGDVAAKVRLSELARRPHLYAIGPLEGLTGEITVLDGRPTISTVHGGDFRTHASLDHGAAFLVWTYEPAWTSRPLPESVRTLEQLQASLPEAARAAGLDSHAPLAFRIEGRVQSLNYHVLSPPPAGPPSLESHEKSKVHSSIPAQAVHMVGFYSEDHHGVFTPGNSDVHVHFVSEDGVSAGHVEDFVLAPGATLLLPAMTR